MLVSDFDFSLPKELIAKEPANPRDSARLLDVSSGLFADKSISNLVDLLNADDLLVLNNTEVIPAHIVGYKNALDGAKIEITLHKMISQNVWQVFAKPAKKLKIADVFFVSSDFYGKVLQKDGMEVTIEFYCESSDFFSAVDKYGKPPLPPYIERDCGAKESDVENYQTIYAEHKGAVAAPTAGLHFTDELFEKLEAKGVRKTFVTLHVGAGTFLPVKSEDTQDHKMHSEYCVVSADAANIINETKQKGGRIVCVGTTSLRTLESATDEYGNISEFAAETDIFITPGYKFKIVDCLLTNFHLPKSTLFMLVCAFSGFDVMHKAYKHAIDNGYRFYSYGDACFLSCVSS